MSGRRLVVLLSALSGALLLAAPAVAGGTPGKGPDAQPPTDQLVVRLAPGSTLDASALATTAGVDLKKVRQLADGSFVLKLGQRHSLADADAISARLASRADVTSAEPDRMMVPFATTPNDPMWSQQWDMLAPASGNYGINLLAAWDALTNPQTIRVGVIDTGYRPHADIASRIIPGYDFIGDALVANDGGGRDTDASDPGDWITSSENASGYFKGCGTSNSSWHGTHVSGTIGAVANNDLGVVGISRGCRSSRSACSASAVAIRATSPTRFAGRRPFRFRRADEHDARSRRQHQPRRQRRLRLDHAERDRRGCGGAARSWSSLRGTATSDASNFTPANCANVITVAATGHTGSRAYYSNYGSTVEIAAPGGDAQLGKTIVSTLNSGTTTPGADSYANYQGTSMATPHVVGVVALMLSKNPSLTPAQVTSLIRSSATPFPSGSSCSTSLCGSGHRQRGGSGDGGGRRRRPDSARCVREDVAGEPRLDLGHLGDAAVERELRRRELRLLPRHDERRRVQHLLGERRLVDVRDRQQPGAGREVLLAGAGDEHRRNDDGRRPDVAYVLDPARLAAPGCLLEVVAVERRHEREQRGDAQLGRELGCDVVRGLHRDVGGDLHDVHLGRLVDVGDCQPVPADDVLLAGARPERLGDDNRERRRSLELQHAVAEFRERGSVRGFSLSPGFRC